MESPCKGLTRLIVIQERIHIGETSFFPFNYHSKNANNHNACIQKSMALGWYELDPPYPKSPFPFTRWMKPNPI